ncbi:hypothetical protein EVAR_103166_1 [Eumeta japonica]|uniref:Uncharacterized protein n=1 Tax=Eumeta variegata TaxID=151549 RepID=A0A4C1YNH9_EUMVA|nr:hypothetical protein EVAR_103166_1 [Eumeta japonica]
MASEQSEIVNKVEDVADRRSLLEAERKQLAEEFNAQRAKMKELFLQKEVSWTPLGLLYPFPPPLDILFPLKRLADTPLWFQVSIIYSNHLARQLFCSSI